MMTPETLLGKQKTVYLSIYLEIYISIKDKYFFKETEIEKENCGKAKKLLKY